MNEATGRPIDRPTVERCIDELGSDLDVHRWLDLWTQDGRKIDANLAICFYHQALQDARQALASLQIQKAVVGCSHCGKPDAPHETVGGPMCSGCLSAMVD